MKKVTKRRKSIDFSNGIRGKYADMNLVIVGATPVPPRRLSSKKDDAATVLIKVRRVLNSAGSSKHELETAIDRARELIDSVRPA